MQHLITYWYLESPARFYSAYRQTVQTLDGTFSVRDTLRNISKPIFQDYTYQGRIIGVLLRLARVVVALFLFLLTALVYAGAFLIWLFFPLICVVSIIGSFL